MHEAVMETARGSKEFPVALLCPRCGRRAVENLVCPETSSPCMTVSGGIPRFLFGQRYWGETSSEKMHQLLREARVGHWRMALQRCAGDEPISKHLLSAVRADFLHAMPWNRIRNVLDIGAGMGFMSCDMALYADSVVSLEAVPERADFIQIRASQDHLNVFPIVANALEMPFPPESFDLITLNGVFEYVGLWGDGDPQVLQERFLSNTLQFLRPGGYLYVGVETRYAWPAFLGHRDHSGLAFTSLMPRRLANAYCRMRARPFYGSEHTVTGYRTYTHTPLQYARMFRRAGYGDVYVQGVFDGYNRQRVLYDINDYAGRQTVLERVNPPASMLGSLRRLVTDNRATYRTLENEVVIFARKATPEASLTAMPWTEVVTAHQTVVQVNQAFKTLAIVFERGVPLELLEAEKKGHEDARQRLERSFEVQCTLQERLKDELPSLPMRWPTPRGTVVVGGRLFRRYAYVHGQTLSARLLPRYYDRRAVARLIERVVTAYVSLCRRLSTCVQNPADETSWKRIREQLDGIEVSEDIRLEFQLAVDAAMTAGWPLSAIHGDFTPGNLIITPSDELVLIDWEHFVPAYPIGADLLRFFQDATMEAARLGTRARGTLRNHLRHVVNAALEACGYQPKDYRHLHALYIAQQIAALGSENRVYQPLLQAYRARRQRIEGAQDDAWP
jgi:SAM-dependent methyltransferase/aminoglycoside phosphotransferase (APT) family kinase protein